MSAMTALGTILAVARPFAFAFGASMGRQEAKFSNEVLSDFWPTEATKETVSQVKKDPEAEQS